LEFFLIARFWCAWWAGSEKKRTFEKTAVTGWGRRHQKP
jgi:hypothetical protein